VSVPYYRVIVGNFTIVGKQPDGDSVRFIAEDPSLYKALHRSYRIKPAKDGSVQLRFELVDAPEVHYGSAAQPWGDVSRDRLLSWMGFTNITFAGNQVKTAEPAQIAGAILTKAGEPNGRPVSYVVLGKDVKTLKNGSWMFVDEDLLEKTINYRMLQEGTAYYTAYSSAPLAHREKMRAAAAAARDQDLGLWALDKTPEFKLIDQTSLGPQGQLILPKLFRRSTDYLKAVNGGFRGNLGDWLEATPSQNDRLVVNDIELKLSDLLDQRNSRVVFQADLLNIVFLEK
jgi:endonuclease YncB( thermonuclease family)